MGIVYKITNIINNKCYIGITKKTFRQRYNYTDKWWSTTTNDHLKNSVKKYGSENFIVEILEKCDNRLLEQREIHYIEKFDSFKNGYNKTTGGSYNYNLSHETKQKISKSKKGCVSHNKGRKMSEESRAKLSKSLKGKVAWNKGLKTGSMKNEHIVKSANAHKKKVLQICKETGDILREYDGIIDSKKDGFNPSCVTLCCKGRIKTHKNYIWKYKDE